MRLILNTPARQAHSVLRYDAWLGDARTSLEHLLGESMASLRCYLMQ